MGQQQLLLLTLGVIVVGTAVLTGMALYQKNRVSANADAMVSDAVRIASAVQTWGAKPAALGGPAGGDLSTATFGKIGIEASGDTYTTISGAFRIRDEASGCVSDASVSAVGAKGAYVVGLSDLDGDGSYESEVCVGVQGGGSAGLETDVVEITTASGF